LKRKVVAIMAVTLLFASVLITSPVLFLVAEELSSSIHDVAVVDVAPYKTVVGQGLMLRLKVTVTNQGDYPETFNVTAYANATTIDIETVTLENGNSATIIFIWNTPGVAYGDYSISAYATPVPGEVDTADNIYVNGIVFVTIPGDLVGDFPGSPADGDCDWFDFGDFAAAYGTTSGQPNYNPLADVIGDTPISPPDDDVDWFDFGIFARYHGKTAF
jgi:hypothetical protein